jgi:hypothetical protein
MNMLGLTKKILRKAGITNQKKPESFAPNPIDAVCFAHHFQSYHHANG